MRRMHSNDHGAAPYPDGVAVVTSAEMRRNQKKIIENVARGGDHVAVTHYGWDRVVVVPADWYRSVRARES